MAIADELAGLFQRDLTKVLQELQAFGDEDVIWRCPAGITNSAGNLVLHLEGNLREYVGRLLGGIPYRRARDQEFSGNGVPVAELAVRIEEVRGFVPRVIEGLSEAELEARFPEDPLGGPISTRQYLIHLHGHLNYHLGQINYLRRMLTPKASGGIAG